MGRGAEMKPKKCRAKWPKHIWIHCHFPLPSHHFILVSIEKRCNLIFLVNVTSNFLRFAEWKNKLFMWEIINIHESREDWMSEPITLSYCILRFTYVKWPIWLTAHLESVLPALFFLKRILICIQMAIRPLCLRKVVPFESHFPAVPAERNGHRILFWIQVCTSHFAQLGKALWDAEFWSRSLHCDFIAAQLPSLPHSGSFSLTCPLTEPFPVNFLRADCSFPSQSLLHINSPELYWSHSPHGPCVSIWKVKEAGLVC